MNNGQSVNTAAASTILIVGDSPPVAAIERALRSRVGADSVISVKSIEAALVTLEDVNVRCLVYGSVSSSGGTESAESSAKRDVSGSDEDDELLDPSEFIETLVDRAGDRPVIAVTAQTSAERALEAGASDVIDPETPVNAAVSRIVNATERYRLESTPSEHRFRTLLESSSAVVLVLDADGNVTFASPALESALEYASSEIERLGLSRLIHPEDLPEFRRILRRIADGPVGASDRIPLRVRHEDGFWVRRSLTLTNRVSDPAVDGIVGTIAETDGDPPSSNRITMPTDSLETAIREAMQIHDQVRARCDRLESAFDCALVTGWDLRRAESRTQVEERLCEGLLSLETIDLAWIGRLSPEVLEITPVTRAGERDEYLDRQTFSLEGEDPTPTATTAITGSRTVVEDITRKSADTQWARTALEEGIRSICSVPLAFRGVRYGCLTLCSAEPAAFDQRTVDAASALGETGALLINRTDMCEALYTDQVTELEVLADARDDPLVGFVASLGQRVDVEAFVPRSTAGSVGMLSIRSAAEMNGDDFVSGNGDGSVPGIDGVRSTTIVGEDSASTTVQIQFTEPTVGDLLVEQGAIVRSVEPVGSRIRLTIEISADREVRRIVEIIENRLSGTKLITRRSDVEPRERHRRFEDELASALTDRQLRTLQTAYFSGYFESPREQTGEEIADALDVSQPTFTRHFRTAQRKLFELLFEDR